MYVTFLAGGIAAGKSTVARELEGLGALRIDLDRLSRDVLAPGAETTTAVARAFGDDLVDPLTGRLDRGLLARRAFATPQAAALLESIELPAIRQLLAERLEQARTAGRPCCVIEIPLLDRMGDLRDLADEVVVVTCSPDRRRRRAVARAMDPSDFDARASNQPSDEWLRSHADTVLENDGTADELAARARAWWSHRAERGWGSNDGL